jgi:hypothetical protein
MQHAGRGLLQDNETLLLVTALSPVISYDDELGPMG